MLIRHNINISKMTDALGESRSNVYNLFKSDDIRLEQLKKICSYAGINYIEFLENMETKRLPDIMPVRFDDPNAIVHVDVPLEAGDIAEFDFNQDELYGEGLYAYKIPSHFGGGFSFSVEGWSMYGDFMDGDTLITEKNPVARYEDIKDGYVYAVATEHNFLVKRIYKRSTKRGIILVSDNPDKDRYPNQSLELNEIRWLLKGKKRITENLSGRSGM
jgi:DNA-binding Xre family transcriptional regulator